jgi:NRPS condensation-like uncharacterized protein
MHGRLNNFQKTMVQWNTWHPYNAVHGVRVPGPLDLERVRRCVDEALERWGLTGLELNPEQGRYRYHGGPSGITPRVVAGAEKPETLLAAQVERELNAPFPATGKISPFRCFVVQEPQDYWLCLAYFHAVADAESIASLLGEVARILAGAQGSTTSAPVPATIVGRDSLWWRRVATLVRKLTRLPGQVRDMRSSSRPCYRDAADFNNGFRLFCLRPPELKSLLLASKAWEVTLNDLVLALLLKALSSLSPASRRTGHRSRISVGNIVNVREDLARERRRGFGVFLGSFVVTHAVPEGIGLRDLARDIRRMTLPIKQRRLYLGMGLELTVARLALRFFSTERRKKFYQKFFPLWGGVTNMNLNALWAPLPGQSVPDYFRAVSTGPATPLVLSLTTAGEVANIGLSYRTTVYSRAEIEILADRFLRAVREETEPA